MDRNRSIELVRVFFDSITKSDSERMRPLLTETVCFWVPRSAADGGEIERSIHGRENVVGLVSQHAYFKEIEWVFEQVVVDDDLIAVHTSAHGTTRTDKTYENEYHFLFRLRGEQIDEVWEILDTAYAFAQIN
jgi:ketosteroid isomerase-like protein